MARSGKVTVVGSGFTVASATVLGTATVPVQASITTSSAGAHGLRIKGSSNQLGILLEVVDSTNAQKFYVNQYGNTFANGGLQVSNFSGNSPLNAALILKIGRAHV